MLNSCRADDDNSLIMCRTAQKIKIMLSLEIKRKDLKAWTTSEIFWKISLRPFVFVFSQNILASKFSCHSYTRLLESLISDCFRTIWAPKRWRKSGKCSILDFWLHEWSSSKSNEKKCARNEVEVKNKLLEFRSRRFIGTNQFYPWRSS